MIAMLENLRVPGRNETRGRGHASGVPTLRVWSRVALLATTIAALRI